MLKAERNERTSHATQQSQHSREFTEVVTGHLRLDFHGGERLSVVDTTDGSDHLGDDDHVSQVGLDGGRLLVGCGILLGLSQLLEKTEVLSLESSLEPSSCSGVDELRARISDKRRLTSVLVRTSMNCWLERSRSLSSSIPRYWYFLKVRFLFSSAASLGSVKSASACKEMWRQYDSPFV